MIKLENVVLDSLEQMKFIIEGMRNPMNSWEKSDSGIGCDDHLCRSHCAFSPEWCGNTQRYVVGLNDHSLMQRLSNAGTEHRKYMRMMPVYVRITAPLYWWKEFDTYKVGTVANSCSTMHKIQEKEFTLDDFSHEHLDIRTRKILEETIKALNDYRYIYINGYTIRTYDNYGSKVMTTTGDKINIQGNPVKTTSYSSDGSVVTGYEMSSVITINIDGKEIQSCVIHVYSNRMDYSLT